MNETNRNPNPLATDINEADPREPLDLTPLGRSPVSEETRLAQDLTARAVFQRLAKENKYFVFGKKVVTFKQDARSSGSVSICVVSPDQLRSILAEFFYCFKRRHGATYPVTASKREARLLLENDQKSWSSFGCLNRIFLDHKAFLGGAQSLL
jgi:hypothetical protein